MQARRPGLSSKRVGAGGGKKGRRWKMTAWMRVQGAAGPGKRDDRRECGSVEKGRGWSERWLLGRTGKKGSQGAGNDEKWEKVCVCARVRSFL